MFRSIRTQRSVRGLAAVAFTLALALRVLVPSGFMPTQTVQGLVVAICDGVGGGKTMVIDLQGPQDQQQPTDHHDQTGPCAFADLSVPAMVADAQPVPPAPAMLLREFALPPPLAANPVRPSYLSPPSRGPPALA